MLLYQTLEFTIHGKISNKSQKNNKLKISTPMQNDKFELAEVISYEYSVSDIQDYFQYLLKHAEKIDNPPIKIDINKI